MELSDLMVDESTIMVDVKSGTGEKLTVKYKPSAYTVGFRMSFNAGTVTWAKLMEVLADEILVSWDLQENGEDIPIDGDSFVKLPSAVMERILVAIESDSRDTKN